MTLTPSHKLRRSVSFGGVTMLASPKKTSTKRRTARTDRSPKKKSSSHSHKSHRSHSHSHKKCSNYYQPNRSHYKATFPMVPPEYAYPYSYPMMPGSWADMHGRNPSERAPLSSIENFQSQPPATPRSELQRFEPVRYEAPRSEPSRPEAQWSEAPRSETPRSEGMWAEAPRSEMPRFELPRSDVPRSETPRFDEPLPTSDHPEVPQQVDMANMSAPVSNPSEETVLQAAHEILIDRATMKQAQTRLDTIERNGVMAHMRRLVLEALGQAAEMWESSLQKLDVARLHRCYNAACIGTRRSEDADMALFRRAIEEHMEMSVLQEMLKITKDVAWNDQLMDAVAFNVQSRIADLADLAYMAERRRPW